MNCNLLENQRKAGTLCRSMHCKLCPPYRVLIKLKGKVVSMELRDYEFYATIEVSESIKTGEIVTIEYAKELK